jgi:CheY-like chemotaxis protein
VVKTKTGDKLRVLVVENEPIAREILGDLLKMAGYEVLSAHTGEHALLTLVQERGRIDCLFTALELPGLVDGWMLADEFRVVDASRPVVFAARAKPGKGRRPQGAAFVAHPVLPPKAVDAVNKVTGRLAAGPKPPQSPRVVVETAALQPVEMPPLAVPGALLKAG